ncbi:hypothetical protein [Bacillus mycoides]|uniref:hypothetical protein n=1 Tax=Bacillus mycoides TaxID=1405 RepID=UPI003D1EC964
MTNKVVGYTNSDIHLTTLKEIILDERYLFIDTFKNEFTNTQYQTLKKVLQKDDILYISSLSDLGQNYHDILTEWLELTRNIQIFIIVLDLNMFIKNKIIKNKNLENINLLNEFILEMLYSLPPTNIIKEKIKTPTPTLINSVTNKYFDFPVQFVETYHEWKKGNITLLAALKRCKTNGPHFYTLIKLYEKTLK